jgi:hypothetical protein
VELLTLPLGLVLPVALVVLLELLLLLLLIEAKERVAACRARVEGLPRGEARTGVLGAEREDEDDVVVVGGAWLSSSCCWRCLRLRWANMFDDGTRSPQPIDGPSHTNRLRTQSGK